MKTLTVKKAQELIDQLTRGERSCREDYYLQALQMVVEGKVLWDAVMRKEGVKL